MCQDEKIEGGSLGSDFHKCHGLLETAVIMCFCSDDLLKNAEYIEYMASPIFGPSVCGLELPVVVVCSMASMPNQPRLEADGLPSVDFAIRSPNVEETSSDDEGPSHRERRPDEHLSESNDGGLSGYLDEIPLTEMDGPTPGSPPRGEKPRGVPGSPSPLQIEDTEAPSAAPAVVGRAGRAALAFMPSPVRGRRSLSPKSVAEAPVGKARPNSYGRGNNTDLMDDSIMGASPDTEASLDSLASFFQDGHYHVPLRVPAGDGLLEEPPHQERDCLSSQDGIARCCQHGVPCAASFPSPDAIGGPGVIAGAGRYAHDTSAGAADSQELRSGVPRIPGPTAHQCMAEFPSTSLSPAHLSPVNARSHPAPSRAPVFAEPVRTGEGPAPEPPQDAPQQTAYLGDVSSQGAAPGSETTSAARPRPSAPVPEAFVPDFTSPGAGLPSAGVPLPAGGPQSAGPMPAEPEVGTGRFGPAELRTEGQVFSALPAQSGQHPPVTFGNQVMPGFAPQTWGFGGVPPTSQGPFNQGAFPYATSPPVYGTGQRLPQFQQDMSRALPALHPSGLGFAGAAPAATQGFSGAAPAASQGPIAPPMPAPMHGPGMGMPAMTSAATMAAPPPQVPLPTHGQFGAPPQPTFPAMPATMPAAMPAAGQATASGETAMPGLRTMGRMPEEDDALEGQGPVPARAESGSGIPPALSTSAAPTAPVAPVSNAGVRRVPPVLRTEAPIPPQSDVVQPSARHGAPPSATQGSSQTEGRQPEVLEEGVTEDERSTPNLSQGQLFPDQQENASESEVKDLHHVDIGVSPSRFQVDSPVAPSGAPDDDILDDASHQLDTPPPAIPRTDQGQQTTPQKTRMPKKRPQQEPIRLPRDGDFKLVQVDMDEVRSCNQAQGRPKRKQMRVLESWKNERVLYERVPGSACPTICSVIVAQPLEKDQKAIPLELNLAEDMVPQEKGFMEGKAWSPLPSNKSDSTYMHGQSEEEILSVQFEMDQTEEEGEGEVVPRDQVLQSSKRAKTTKSIRSRLRKVQMAAEAGSAAAAATFDVATPERVRPSHTANGFVRVPIAEGSTDACEIRVGLDNGSWMSCDINIPPRSFNTPEQLAENRSLLIYVLHCQDGAFDAQVGEDIVTLATGSSMVIRPGEEYCLRNGSDQEVAQLKMVLINSSRS